MNAADVINEATGVEHYCTHCQHSAPCPTIAALDGEADQ